MSPTAPSSLAAALAAVQANLPEVAKGETATVPTKAGGSYKYSYADLAAVTRVILPRLGAVGLSWTTKPTILDGRFVLEYKLLHTSGEAEVGCYPLPDRGSPQEIGSAITYARRYALCSVTGVAPDDDDDAAEASRGAREYSRPPQQRDSWDDAKPARRGPASAAGRTDATSEPPTGGQKVGQDQHRKMHALWRDLGYGGDEHRDTRLSVTAKVLGLDELNSSADLTREQADRVIASLQQRKRQLDSTPAAVQTQEAGE